MQCIEVEIATREMPRSGRGGSNNDREDHGTTRSSSSSSDRPYLEHLSPSEPPEMPLASSDATTTAKPPSSSSCCACIPKQWSKLTNGIHNRIQSLVVQLAVHAARHPKRYVFTILLLAPALFITGLMTNYNVNFSTTAIFAPFNSKAKYHSDWIDYESGFPEPTRLSLMSIHADGNNVLDVMYMRRVFDAVQYMTDTPDYGAFCAKSGTGNSTNDNTTSQCKITGLTQFFDHNVTEFDQLYEHGGQEAILRRLYGYENENDENNTTSTSSSLQRVELDLILGNAIVGVDDDENSSSNNDNNATSNNSSSLISSLQSYSLFFELIDQDGVLEFEARLLERMKALQEQWLQQKPTNSNGVVLLKVEYVAMRSYSDEMARAVQEDLPLIPLGFGLMASFTCLVFIRCRDRVQSRCLLGIGSVFTILLSLLTSFGLVFCIGIPYTNMTQVIPFVVFGVGLDDTFMITGAYFRTDPRKDPAERVEQAMQEIGLSISVTTLTTMLAFLIGCISTIPAIFWLNLYALPCIAIDFFYQITFFVALLVLDERRIQARRMDCCLCVRSSAASDDGASDTETECDSRNFQDEKAPSPRKQQHQPKHNSTRDKSVPERFMGWYARHLLRPWVKIFVIVAFLAHAGFCAYSTSLLTQHFDFGELLPEDSYARGFLHSIEAYTSRILGVSIYFRGDFDQLDPDMQQRMNEYVDELGTLPQFADEPVLCWFRDLQDFPNSEVAQSFGIDTGFWSTLTLQEQVDIAFSFSEVRDVYGSQVVFDETGKISASSCYTYLSGINLKVAKEQIQVLQDQRAISARQPINEGTEDWSFFTFNSDYFIWEFYSAVVEEQLLTTIAGILSVCAIGFIFFPHWKAILFLFPLMSMLYICLLGTIQYVGLYINAVSCICLVISIGLLVDFIVHILLRYFESHEKTREGKVRDTLETVGASILLGGLSTSLSVLPLALSTSVIVRTVFICFFAMITLGVTHGLVFLPVVLSIWGPLVDNHDDDNALHSTGGTVESFVGTPDSPMSTNTRDPAASDTDDTDEDDNDSNGSKPHSQISLATTAQSSVPFHEDDDVSQQLEVIHLSRRYESFEVVWNNFPSMT
ncbi:Pick C1-like protein 1 [Seminavis robusta]|uniref:Pick C1-like protein 1 n=1 Tax=Seminavis robusta TaxID=568900 RepID=A0A9N8HQF7_9STRA|nr:Pick C1-like protein 1 [Seminavis robusta]|eukprot:Sro1283_g259140.1 Pick C1-like protein 1 (1095) ;mRNA; r:20864-24701